MKAFNRAHEKKLDTIQKKNTSTATWYMHAVHAVKRFSYKQGEPTTNDLSYTIQQVCSIRTKL